MKLRLYAPALVLFAWAGLAALGVDGIAFFAAALGIAMAMHARALLTVHVIRQEERRRRE